MTDRYSLCYPFVFEAEGGYSCDPTDGGNWKNGLLVGSKYGITWQDLRTTYGYQRITTETMRNLTKAQAISILRSQYWNATNAGNLWAGLDLMILDFGFNAGNVTAVKELQTILGFTGDDVDGDNGPKTTKAALDITDRVAFLGQLKEIELAHYKTLDLWAKDGNGWTNRANARLDLACRMVADPSISK